MHKNFDIQKSFFRTHETLPYEFRVRQLKTIERMLVEEKESILEALYQDLKKPRTEAIVAEWGFVLEEVRFTLKSLKKWMKPQKIPGTLAGFPSKSSIYTDPLGVVLIMGPWNYPFQLVMAPLIGAIAAGNCVMIKPSEIAASTAQLLQELILKYFDSKYVSVILGGIPETTELLKLPFDHIFFTGSTKVGRIIAEAAATNLTPVTLELGGKSPAVICKDTDLKTTARRIVWGKFYNAGQTCVAPDYLYVDVEIEETFKKTLNEEIKTQFGADASQSQSYGRVINKQNFSRLVDLIQQEKVFSGGRSDEKSLYVEPTLLHNCTWEDEALQEEIFGPILPIISFTNVDHVFEQIRNRPKPLSAYCFTKDSSIQSSFLKYICAGGVTINDVLMHLTNPHLPFGGVGASGQGRYHGRHSFRTFSHEKSVLKKSFWFDLKARYAPYTPEKTKFLERFIVRN